MHAFLLCVAVAGPHAVASTAEPAVQRATLAVAPPVGLQLKRTFVLEQTLAAQRMSLEVNGVAQPGPTNLEVASRYRLRGHDDVQAVEGARVTRFSRAFDEGQLHVETKFPDPQTLDAASPLGGASVLFTWIPARSEYGRLYDHREASEEFLKTLDPSLDLASFVPAGERGVGDTWEVDPRAAREAFAPCGEIPLRFGKESNPILARSVDLGLGGPLWSVLDRDVKGAIRCRLAAFGRDAAGPTAEIEVQMDVTAERDIATEFTAHLSPLERGQGFSVKSSRLAWKCKCQGRLVWSVVDGVPRSLDLAGPEEVSSATELVKSGETRVTEVALAGGAKLSYQIEATRR